MSGAYHSPSRGWTLVELLIAMTLSLLVIAGIGQIYLAAKRSYEIQNSLARLQDVGRYVTDLLTHDIHNAGYWGLMDMSSITPTGLTPAAPICDANTTWGTMVKQKIFGFDSTQDPSGYACIDGDRTGGDVLTVRYGDPSTSTPYSGSGLYIRTSPTSGDIEFGPDTAPLPSPSSDHELQAHVYYLTRSDARECGNPSSPRLPALAREHLETTGSGIGKPRKQELVTGVEELQFQYLVDINGDGTIYKYLDATDIDAVDWDKVKAVRFWVLVRGDCPEADYIDTNEYQMGNSTYTPKDDCSSLQSPCHYRRALYTSTAALQN
jgi:type IV pilus assembly protein PilW